MTWDAWDSDPEDPSDPEDLADDDRDDADDVTGRVIWAGRGTRRCAAVTKPTRHTSLPAVMIDLIREGVSTSELKTSGDRAVFKALVSTAASALQRGWSFAEWSAEVQRGGSKLGEQCRIDSRMKSRSGPDVLRQLQNAWDRADAWVARQPARLTDADIATRISEVRSWLAHPGTTLPDAERHVLGFACDVAETNNTTRPTLPRRAVQQATGLGERATRETLRRLDEAGLLKIGLRGRPALDETRRRAAAYQLPDRDRMTAYLYRKARSVGPPTPDLWDPHPTTVGTPRQTYGTPTEPKETSTMIRIELPDADTFARALAALQREGIHPYDDNSGTRHTHRRRHRHVPSPRRTTGPTMTRTATGIGTSVVRLRVSPFDGTPRAHAKASASGRLGVVRLLAGCIEGRIGSVKRRSGKETRSSGGMGEWIQNPLPGGAAC